MVPAGSRIEAAHGLASDRAGRSGFALALAGAAALLASSCCVLPLVFVLVGVSGAWIGQLTRLEPYSMGLDALAIGALALAAWRIYRPVPAAAPLAGGPAAAGCGSADGAACARTRPVLRATFWLVALLVLLPIAVPLLAPLFY